MLDTFKKIADKFRTTTILGQECKKQTTYSPTSNHNKFSTPMLRSSEVGELTKINTYKASTLRSLQEKYQSKISSVKQQPFHHF